MRSLTAALVAFAALAFTAPLASAESLVFRVPADLASVPVPAPGAERYAARGMRVSRHEVQTRGGVRRIIFADLPSAGRLASEPVGSIAQGIVSNVGSATCVEHTVSNIREFVIDGRDAAEFTLICRGIVENGRADPQTIDVRRTVLVQGETRFYNFQADEYAPIEGMDPAASAGSWYEVVVSLRWCAGDAECEPR